MDKRDIKSFFVFLDQATDEEIEKRKELFEQLLKKISSRSDTAADVRFCLRKIDEELVARNEFEFSHRQKQMKSN